VPVWTYEVGDQAIEARIWMEPGAHTTYAAWRLRPSPNSPDAELSLRITLLVNGRDHHATMPAGGFAPEINADRERLRIVEPGAFTLTICAPGAAIVPKHDWYRDFDLPIEAERDLDSVDNHLCAGELMLPLVPGQWCGFVASLDPEPSTDVEAALGRRLDHDRSVVSTAFPGPAAQAAPPWIVRLALAADAFVFARPLAGVPDGKSVIAGYPWFGDWGRDTMISLPGLTLATGRPEIARRILQTFASFVSQGMLPNVYPGAGDVPQYNTADASLWLAPFRNYPTAICFRRAALICGRRNWPPVPNWVWRWGCKFARTWASAAAVSIPRTCAYWAGGLSVSWSLGQRKDT